MTLQKMAACAGIAVGLATASSGIAATAGTAAAGASARAGNASRTAQPVSSQDRMFMDEASQINLTEISLGGFMQTHATTTAAKNLGGRYVRDHTTAQANLRALASRLHVTVPAPSAQLKSMVTRVEGQKGRNMDVAFARTSVSGHQTAIAIFRKEESAGSNPTVKAYAAHYLPMLHTHLRLAKQAESALHVAPTSHAGG